MTYHETIYLLLGLIVAVPALVLLLKDRKDYSERPTLDEFKH